MAGFNSSSFPFSFFPLCHCVSVLSTFDGNFQVKIEQNFSNSRPHFYSFFILLHKERSLINLITLFMNKIICLNFQFKNVFLTSLAKTVRMIKTDNSIYLIYLPNNFFCWYLNGKKSRIWKMLQIFTGNGVRLLKFSDICIHFHSFSHRIS